MPPRRVGGQPLHPIYALEILDHLAEAGIEDVSDWMNDDQPYELRTAAGPLVSVPYTLELNDIPMMVIQHHTSDAWSLRARDQFDRLYAERARRPRVMAPRPPSLHLGGAAPDHARRGCLRLLAEAQSRLAHDRRGDLRVVAAGPPVVVSARGSARV